MHDAAFARAAVASPTVILKLPLRPYAVGHALWLEAEGNPLAAEVGEKRIQPRDVTEAVWVCANTWRELATMHRAWLTLAKIRAWRWMVRGEDLALAVADFANYRRSGSSIPPVGRVGEGGRIAGGPILARLVQFLIQRLGKTELEAMDYPLGLAYWHFAVHQESEGALKVLNGADIEFEEWCAEQEIAANRRRQLGKEAANA